MIRAVLRIGCKGIQLFRFNALCGRLSTRSVVRRSVTGPRAQAPGRGPHSPHGILRKRASETQELQGPQEQQKQNSRNHRSRRNPGLQRPPVPPAETQKTLRPPHVCGSWRVRHRMPRPERSGKASVLLRLRCGAGIPARRAAPLPTSRRAVRPAPRSSRSPGRRNRADPYRRGSGDRRSRSPSGSPADRPCPGWRPR